MDSKPNPNPNSNFGNDIAEAEQEFVQQFDKTSSTYHHGDPTPVPVGEKHVPDSMPTEIDPEYIKRSQESENINYGPEYDKLMQLRAGFQDLKKVLNKVCPPHEAVLRIRAGTGEEAKKEEQIKAEMSKIEEPIKEVANFNEKLKGTEYAEKYCAGLEAICKDAF